MNKKTPGILRRAFTVFISKFDQIHQKLLIARWNIRKDLKLEAADKTR